MILFQSLKVVKSTIITLLVQTVTVLNILKQRQLKLKSENRRKYYQENINSKLQAIASTCMVVAVNAVSSS